MNTNARGPVARHLLAWLAMPVLAIANGTLRELTYGRRMNDDASHALSTLPLLVLVALYTALVARKWPLQTRAQALIAGAGGFLFATGFEFGFGRLEGRSWGELFHDYNLLAGRLWLFVPLALLVAPEVHRLRQRRERRHDEPHGLHATSR